MIQALYGTHWSLTLLLLIPLLGAVACLIGEQDGLFNITHKRVQVVASSGAP